MTAACGFLEPTPARFRPPLPAGQPMPGLAVEDVVEDLEAAGFDCSFDRGGDIPASWHCRSGDQEANDFLDVSLRSERTGPIELAGAYGHLVMGDEEVPEDQLDADAAGGFHPIVSAIVPEEHRPSPERLGAGVRSNFPMELGGGWFLGFDRNVLSRTLTIVYAEP